MHNYYDGALLELIIMNYGHTELISRLTDIRIEWTGYLYTNLIVNTTLIRTYTFM